MDSVETLWLFIKGGKSDPRGICPLEKYSDRTPQLLELKFKESTSKVWDISFLSPKQIESQILEYYKHLIQDKTLIPSRYGEWVKLTKYSFQEKTKLNLDVIGHAAWQKPTLAADLGIFVKDTTSIYFIGIIRGNDPGKGKPAILGGIRDSGYFLDSAAYTAIKEAKEEAGLKIIYPLGLEQLREDYAIQNFEVFIKGFEKIEPSLRDLRAEIRYATKSSTPESERNTDGTKRVYETTAYGILIDLKQTSQQESISITKTDLRKVFTAGDDASMLYIQDVKEIVQTKDFTTAPDFGLEHHLYLFKKIIQVLFES